MSRSIEDRLTPAATAGPSNSPYEPPAPGLPSTPPGDPNEEQPLSPAKDAPVPNPEPSTMPSPVTI